MPVHPFAAANRRRLTTPVSLLAAAVCVLTLSVRTASAQPTPETVRGRVVDDSARVITAATVIVTRGPDRLVRETTTDSTGRYNVHFDEGTGDYLVHVAAPGFLTARRRVQRQNSERELVADFTLTRDPSLLATVKVVADKPVRASNSITPYGTETGASEKWADGVSGQTSPTVTGDLNALAATMPGVTLTPGGPSMLGASSASNLTTLNGLALPSGSIPRAARTETRVTGATFDPTRGGFAGANIDVRLGAGDRFYQRRNGFVTLDAPQLQFTDAIGRSLGLPTGGFRASVGADGELIRKALTYNVALDVARNSSDPATLLGADPATLLRAGIAPDSVNRLVEIATPLGVPLGGSGIPAARTRDALTWLGRLDDTRDTLRTLTLTTYAGRTRDGALGFGPLAAPAAGGTRTERTYGAQFVHGAYVGPGHRILTETRLAASKVHNTTEPYRALPGATVLVRSPTLDGQSDVTTLTVGGSPWLANDDARWTLEGANETIWNAHGRRHRFKALVWARGDGLRQDAIGNQFGAYTFNSLADLAANRPSMFTRTLVQPVRTGSAWNAATAVAHQYAPSRFFSVLYGARIEGSAFGDTPPRNAALENALGVATGLAPMRVHVSPRAGFNWLYNRDKNNGNGSSSNNVGRFYRSATGVVRGGIGDFRDLLRPNVLADAMAGTGLSGSASALSCVGAAVPVPDWTAFATDPSAIPTRCADGSGALGERAPTVSLIDRHYDVPHSWRASLNWMSNLSKFLVKVDALTSYDLSQPSTVDANFTGVPKFTLLSERARPVFVSAGAIDATSGAVSVAEARRSADFGRVGVRKSDLRGYGGQVTFSVAPDMFRFRSRHSVYVSTAYTLQGIRQQFRGFDGAGFGDPREREWAASQNDARHAFVLQGGVSARWLGTVTLFGRMQSGLPFTPVVQGDINGDGRANDRAFVPDPAVESDAQLVAQMQALLSTGNRAVDQCLRLQLGNVAGRNSCRGPWTHALNLQWKPPLPVKIRGHRTSANVYFENTLGGIDQMLHGEAGLRGWGSQASPDATLLVTRGFDAAAKRFRYDVNPRFGDTRGARTLSRAPFRVTIDFSIDLSTDYNVQQLRRALEPVKVAGTWQRRTADSLTAFYLSNTSNIHKALLAESDSLFLSATQIAALRKADTAFSIGVRAIFRPLGEYLALSTDARADKAALDSVTATQKAYWKLFWLQPEIADAVVTPTQRELFQLLKGMVATPQKDRENSQWQFGHPITVR